MIYLLGQARDRGREIEVSSTFELNPGDLIVIDFPFGSRGWIKYGIGEEAFQVVSVDPESGDVEAVDEAGGGISFPGGSRAELEARLTEMTSWSSIRVFRPSLAALGPPGPAEQAQSLGLPSGYEEIAASSWAELSVGDHVYSSLGAPWLFRVERADPDLIIARVVGSDDPSRVGELVYHLPEDGFWETDYVFRKSGLAVASSWLLPAGAAAAGLLLVWLA